MERELIKNLLARQPVGEQVTVAGWVKTRRDASGFSFLEIGDGSSVRGLQVIAESTLANYQDEIKKMSTGCSVIVNGELRESPAKGQSVELLANRIELVGWADPAHYPLQKKRHSFEFLREITHLRPRTNALAAVARVRSHLSMAVHRFFQERQFTFIHTPIITTSDCEGAGELFQVITEQSAQTAPREQARDFFGRPAGLTVSGQLQAEVYASALGSVYTFGPTFRAENSNTSRHLAEFWMLEPEMAFCDLACAVELARELLVFLIESNLETCGEDLELFDRFVEKGLLAKLGKLASADFVRITYTEAIEELAKSGRSFEFPHEWGMDLQSEHERFLVEEVFQAPLIVTDYPATLKPFYMRLNDDGVTVAAMDVLIGGIGEIIGGSQREERYEVLLQRMEQGGIDIESLQWYLDLRRYGTVPHAGFGLGFERLMQCVTGMANIREVIGFPRAPGFAPC
ncbi:MAG: asparagine--tRNA ligase [Desulfofustis sp. PB-SRB1]|jgi:asparaginyl-tRNA synthetase|nr:asparagine--tRNA ligase [Desulfofustis sp. PB-SRB1]MBM1001741.1 asparagine--tRNA ligase [Desulfofustis sp. PB-SRB1]HBH29375.1 asparagine--tRNA ligase [Desulfofustis sp.]HBH32308.1 asparagine--tRNA ligase [Desulfofustis sp.]